MDLYGPEFKTVIKHFFNPGPADPDIPCLLQTV